MTLDALREAFPHTRSQTYFNHAATGVYSRRVVAAIEADVLDRHGRDVDNFPRVLPKVEACLEALGRLMHVPTERVEFAANTSEALALVAEHFDWRPGDRVAVPACEFPANVYPFLNLERRGVHVDLIPHHDGVVTPEAVAAALTDRTRLVSASWVQFLSGYRLDLKAVADAAHAAGALLCVDAIQGLGALRLDAAAAGVDFLACGAQKWMLGPQGLAFFYLSEAMQARLRPRAGWLHGPVDWENFFAYDLAFHPGARGYRLGTLNHMGALALGAALDLYADAGPAACEARVLAHAAALAEGLGALGLARFGSDDPAAASGIVTVRHPDPDGLVAYLAAHAVTVSARNRMVRISPTYYNSPDEVARVLDLVGAYGKTTVPTP